MKCNITHTHQLKCTVNVLGSFAQPNPEIDQKILNAYGQLLFNHCLPYSQCTNFIDPHLFCSHIRKFFILIYCYFIYVVVLGENLHLVVIIETPV